MKLNAPDFSLSDFSLAMPAIFLLCMTCVILLTDVMVPARMRSRVTGCLTQGGLVVTLLLVLASYQSFVRPVIVMGGSFIQDRLSLLTQLFILVTTVFAFVYARPWLREFRISASEYYVLGLFAVLGMLVMASAWNFLVAWLGLELLSLAMYAMVALDRQSARAVEAAMKFFVMGGLASGILLYGVSLVYGATGSIDFSAVDAFLHQTSGGDRQLALAGMLFIATGLLFKLGTVPFHMWVPDVYEGAPACMTLFIACAPKIATFCIVMRILGGALSVSALQWQQVLVVISILSMFAGNLMAIAQTSIRRMLAYSSIAHMGYVLLGVIAGPLTQLGYSAALFYMVTYVMVAGGAFAVVALLSREGQPFERLDDLRGLNARQPWIAFLMLLMMFSMAGVPPVVGFFAKLGLLQVLVEAHYVWLAALSLLFAIIGAYYYLRVVMYMYFEEPAESVRSVPLAPGWVPMTALTVNAFAALALGLFPGALLELCRVSVY